MDERIKIKFILLVMVIYNLSHQPQSNNEFSLILGQPQIFLSKNNFLSLIYNINMSFFKNINNPKNYANSPAIMSNIKSIESTKVSPITDWIKSYTKLPQAEQPTQFQQNKQSNILPIKINKLSILCPTLYPFFHNETSNMPMWINRVQYEGNQSTEDRIVVKQLKNKEGVLIAVFDGHGGQSLAQYASKRIYNLFEKSYEQLKKIGVSNIEAVKTSLSDAFNGIQNGFYERASEDLRQKKRHRKVGSCALCCILTQEFICVANAGDSKAILVSNETGNTIELNKIFNTHNKQQQQRLLKQFPDEDILVTSTKNGAKYLKGCLIPTRCLGDLHMKHKQFAQGIIKFTRPYITHEPQLFTHIFQSHNYYLVVGSDGLWDQLNDEQVSKVVLSTEDINKADALVDASLVRIAEKNETTIQKIKDINPKKRRDYHDDISIVVADISKIY